MSVSLRKPTHPALKPVLPFLPSAELAALDYGLKGEESAAIADILANVANTLATMPRTYQTDGQGDAAMIHLHYFRGGSDWYITELDKLGDGRQQAFGFVILNGDVHSAELGYISIEELTAHGVELDLYWTKRTLGELKQARLS